MSWHCFVACFNIIQEDKKEYIDCVVICFLIYILRGCKNFYIQYEATFFLLQIYSFSDIVYISYIINSNTHTQTHTHELPWWPTSKEFACNARDADSIPESRSLLEKEMAIHSSILAWEIPWTEEPGRLLSMESQRVRHDFATKQQQQYVSKYMSHLKNFFH